MSIKPIDIKTDLLANNDASRTRENQKAKEAGLGANVAQNKDADEVKTETVQKNENVEHKKIKKEDEDSEKKQASSKKNSKKENDEKDKKKKEHPELLDGVRGFKIDIKI